MRMRRETAEPTDAGGGEGATKNGASGGRLCVGKRPYLPVCSFRHKAVLLPPFARRPPFFVSPASDFLPRSPPLFSLSPLRPPPVPTISDSPLPVVNLAQSVTPFCHFPPQPFLRQIFARIGWLTWFRGGQPRG